MSYIRSPINYTGCKYKLLPSIIPLFPSNINMFLDVFGGSGTLTLNVKANIKFYNEINMFLYEIIEKFKEYDEETIINHINKRILEFDLKRGYNKKVLSEDELKENEEIKKHYLEFRDFLNNKSDNKPLDLLTIHYYAFNNLIRHTKKEPIKYNTPSGVGSKSYSPNLHNPLIENACNEFKNINLLNKDFRDIDYSIFSKEDFIYFDPPYLLSNAEYNKNWNEDIEKDLYNICDKLTNKGVKWAMSNMLINNNIKHTLLEDWCNKNNYKIYLINTNYTGWVQLKKNNYNKTQEVLITNY